MFKHLNPWYGADLQEAGVAPGVNSHWSHHTMVKNPVHHDNMSAKHFAMADKHGKLAARHDEDSQASFSRASAITSNGPKAAKEGQVQKHMEAATKHMLACHDHACREDYHTNMAEAHAEFRDHLTGMKGASEKRAHSLAEKAGKVFE